MDFAEAGTVCDSEASQSSSLSLSCGGGQPELRLQKKEEKASSQGPALEVPYLQTKETLG